MAEDDVVNKGVRDTFSPVELRILQLRLGIVDGEKKSCEEVGKRLGLSAKKIKLMEIRSLRKLRCYLDKEDSQ